VKKFFIIIPIIVAAFVWIALSDQTEPEPIDTVFKITLADPALYEYDRVFIDSIDVKKGNYQFRFVPNGDSPKILSITLQGNSFFFSEDFQLEGTLHETGISEYYTWDYLGEKEIKVPSDQILEIKIDPNGNLLGPVSVELLKT